MNKPSLLLVGTFHMAMDPEAVNQQKEHIIKVVESLKRFEPTKIAVEKPFLIEEELNKKYQDFRKDQLVPAYDEVEQFAFRIANKLNHPRLYPVDEMVDMTTPSLNQVFAWAKEHQPELFQDILTIQANLKAMENDETIVKKLQYINNPDYIEELQRIYMKLMRVGDRHHPIGVQWLKQWHQRDLAIAANIARITESEDRILVLIGGDHVHLLNRFLKDSKDFEMPSVLEYLP